jgi:hypothetical protein
MISGWIDLIEDFEFDTGLADLWADYAHLQGRELVLWIASIIVWRIVSDRIEGFASYHARRTLSWGLFRLAVLIKP